MNPLRLLQRIPHGMCVEGLRDRLVHIIADFRTQTSLREGCNTILHTDCLLLAQVLSKPMSLLLSTTINAWEARLYFCCCCVHPCLVSCLRRYPQCPCPCCCQQPSTHGTQGAVRLYSCNCCVHPCLVLSVLLVSSCLHLVWFVLPACCLFQSNCWFSGFCCYHIADSACPVQRLYHEVRHALSHLYVKPCTSAASTTQTEVNRQWQHWSSGAGLGAVVDQQDLPGPQGTKQLHVRRREGPDEEELDTVSFTVQLSSHYTVVVSTPQGEEDLGMVTIMIVSLGLSVSILSLGTPVMALPA